MSSSGDGRHAESRGRALALGWWILCVVSVASSVFGVDRSWLMIDDTSFSTSSWQTLVLLAEPGTSASSVQVGGEDGNFGAFRRTEQFIPSTVMGKGVEVVHLYRAESYDPFLQGAVAAVSFSADIRNVSGGINGRFVLAQRRGTDLDLFATDRVDYSDLPSGWQTNGHRATCLRAEQFDAIGGTTSPVPDFEQGELFVGYLTREGDRNRANINDLDNFRAVFHATTACEGPPDLRVEKSDGNRGWGADGTIEYTTIVSNVGTTAESVALEETVPIGTTFLADLSDPAWSCASGEEGSRCSLSLGILVPGTVREVQFAVEVLPETDPEWDVFNEVRLSRSGSAARVGDLGSPVTAPDSGGEISSQLCTEMIEGFDFNPLRDCDIVEICLLRCDETDGIPIVKTVCEEAPAGSSPRLGSQISAPSPVASTPSVAPPIDQLLLYEIRDRVLQATPGGREVIRLYYEHTRDMLAAAISEPSLFGRLRDAVAAGTPNLRAALAGEADSVFVTSEQVDRIQEFLDELKPVATPALLAAIHDGEQRLDLESLPGRSVTQALARLERLTDGIECVPSATRLCLLGNRFQVEVEWRDFADREGPGRVALDTEDSAVYWFFDPDNWEMLVKMVDGCGNDGHFWFFAAATTNVQYRLTVTDTVSGQQKVYFNPLGRSAPAITDTRTFATCP